MCLVGLRLRTHPGARVLLVGNRDEFYKRPTAAADFWADAPHVLGGRDLEAGGTWLGVTRSGRWATVTNFRAPEERKADRKTRGALVSEFLRGDASPSAYADYVLEHGSEQNGFNLLLGDVDDVVYVSNILGRSERLSEGDHVLSNHHLDTPWPKTRKLREALERASDDEEALLSVLGDRTIAPDADLPDTGVGLILERVLSPMFISTPAYGTRASSLLRIGDDQAIRFVERSYEPDGAVRETRRFDIHH